MRILGLDIGRGAAIGCLLESFPVDMQETYRKLRNNRQFYELLTTTAGVDKLLWLAPDAIILEPTGHWYSHFWVTVAKQHNIAVHWLGHAALAHLRGTYDFTNKRDEEDALCLAASYFDDRFHKQGKGKTRYLTYYYTQNQSLVGIRESFLEKEQLAKQRSGLIAQIKQRLAYEFPEVVKLKMEISKVRGFTPIIGWLAKKHQSARHDNKYRQSIAPQLGISISDYTREHALIVLNLEARIQTRYDWLKRAIDSPEFEPYIGVFDRFGLGIDNKCLLLYHIYPFEKFLLDGKPWIEYDRGKNDKWQKRDRSLRKFQGYLGLSFSYKQSGDSKKRSYHGSAMVRSHLYPWAVCQIAPHKNGYRIDNPIGRDLSDRYQELRKSVKGKDSLMRILFKATRKLFYELVKELC